MMELTRVGGGHRLGFGGDSLNTALYLARLGHHVDFLTGLGADPFSHWMQEQWASEGIGLGLVLRDGQRLPGLYAIETDASGERSFFYWRSDSAARAMFTLDGIDAALDEAAKADLLYLTGITLSLYDEAGRSRLRKIAERVKARGGMVAFDPNYRVRQWCDCASARNAIEEFAKVVSIALPTAADEDALYGEMLPEAIARRWAGFGATETAIKYGSEGCVISTHAGIASVAACAAAIVDTTGAGDGFNAAYLDGRLRGLRPQLCGARGNQLAAAVIGQPGAIIDPRHMPSALNHKRKQPHTDFQRERALSKL